MHDQMWFILLFGEDTHTHTHMHLVHQYITILFYLSGLLLLFRPIK